MDLKNNKFVVYSVIVLLVAVLAFNFEGITGYAGKVDRAAEIQITNVQLGNVLSDRTVARLELKYSFPNQRIRVYRERLDKFIGYSFNTENCKVMGSKSSTEYSCTADLYVTAHELVDGERYYFRAMDRRGRFEGTKAIFTFKE